MTTPQSPSVEPRIPISGSSILRPTILSQTPGTPAPIFHGDMVRRGQSVEYQPLMDYGLGVDTASADVRNKGVQGTPTQIGNAAGDTVTFEMTLISSIDDLQTSLGVSASANGSYGLFSASAKMNYSEQCHFQSNSVFLLVSASVSQAVTSIEQPVIDPAAAALLANGDTSDFQDRYGDMFVRGLTTGGEFYGVIEISTTSTSDQKTLSTSISGSFGLFGASGSVDSSFSNATQGRNVKVTCFIQGGQTFPLPTEVSDLLTAVKAWPGTLASKGVPYTALLADYNILVLPSPPNFIDLQNQKDVLANCASLRSEDLQTVNEIDYITQNQQQFIQPNMADLGIWRNQLSADLNTIAAAASKALDDPKNAQLPSGLTAIGHTLPKRIDGTPVLPPVTVPNLIGMFERDAGDLLTSLGLQLSEIGEVSSTGDNSGDVLSQTPSANTLVAHGSAVAVTIARTE
jgi:hypothetical protein